MPLHKNVSSEAILARLHKNAPGTSAKYREANLLGTKLAQPIPRFKIEQKGQDSLTAYTKIKEDLALDGKPCLNLASFVNTEIDDIGMRLATENLTKNLADSDEYPAMLAIHGRCVSIISHLWNVPENMEGVGTACTGSSEAIHLGGLAMKRTWEKKKGIEPGSGKPNIIMGANAQVALEKFARYFDVEARILPASPDYGYSFDYTTLAEHVDENTIGVFVILGSTYTGHYQDVEAISKQLDKIESEKGWDIPIHVDAASGGFVAPFITPDLVWDFRLPRVVSINTSGHKFGLTTAGCGWIIWKDKKYLPGSLLFTLSYLGGSEETYTLNFSRPGFPVILQYHNLVRLGFEGFKNVYSRALDNARLLSNFLEATGYFKVVSEIHQKGSDGKFKAGLPVVAFAFSDSFREKYPEIPQESIATFLRIKGYILPNYPLPQGCEKQEVLRAVIRGSIPADLLDKLMEDIVKVVQRLVNAVDDYHSAVASHAREPVKVHQMLAAMVAASGDESEHEKFWHTDDSPRESAGSKKHHVGHGTIC